MGIEGEGIDRDSLDENGYPKPIPVNNPHIVVSLLMFLSAGVVLLLSCYSVYIIATQLMK